MQAVEGKALNKEALQAEVGLPVDRKVPLVAFIGRLEEQKGPDVIAAAIPEILDEDVQIVLLVRMPLHHHRDQRHLKSLSLWIDDDGIYIWMQGTGKKKFERLFKSLEERFPEKVRAVVKFNAPLAHYIMAGADLLAVTSRFEPCGLIQLQGMRYGTVYINVSFILTKLSRHLIFSRRLP